MCVSKCVQHKTMQHKTGPGLRIKTWPAQNPLAAKLPRLVRYSRLAPFEAATRCCSLHPLPLSNAALLSCLGPHSTHLRPPAALHPCPG